MDHAALGALIELLRRNGVTSYKGSDGVELHLSPAPAEPPATVTAGEPAREAKEPEGDDIGMGIRLLPERS